MSTFYEKFTVKKTKASDKPIAPAKKQSPGKSRNSAIKNAPGVTGAPNKNKAPGKPRAHNPVAANAPLHSSGKMPELKNDIFNSKSVPDDAKKILETFDKITQSTHPLNSKQKQLLPKDINSLSHHLTDERGERRLGYMNSPVTLTAYIHYFSWWNLVRLTKVFSNLPQDFMSLKDGTVCLDIGSGPLTVVTALFLSRPELRTKKLTWYCMDISSQALSIGENIFLSTAAALKCEPWKIIRVKGQAGSAIKEKAGFITCANVFNELNEEKGIPPEFLAKKYTDTVLKYADLNTNAKVLIVEPGVPKSARLISLMRDCFLRKEFTVCAPCCHQKECPMQGKKGGKWCNFAFSTEDAPKPLHVLSEKAELPKERAVLSFIALQSDAPAEKPTENSLNFIITSDPIKLPARKTGYYACSKKGLLLVITDVILKSGQSFSVSEKLLSNKKTDAKTGALILDLS